MNAGAGSVSGSRRAEPKRLRFQGFNAKSGEPGGNRTLNPQIKSRVTHAKTFQILAIVQPTYANGGRMRPPDGTTVEER